MHRNILEERKDVCAWMHINRTEKILTEYTFGELSYYDTSRKNVTIYTSLLCLSSDNISRNEYDTLEKVCSYVYDSKSEKVF